MDLSPAKLKDTPDVSKWNLVDLQAEPKPKS